MTKLKFVWEFKVSNDERYLELHLNDGINCLIDIFHRNFHENLLDKLIEISIHEHIHGTKTEIKGLCEIEKAKHIYNADFK